jgi:hypothetical protein
VRIAVEVRSEATTAVSAMLCLNESDDDDDEVIAIVRSALVVDTSVEERKKSNVMYEKQRS